MSVPGEDAFTNSRAHLSSLDAPFKDFEGAYPETKSLSRSGIALAFPALVVLRIPEAFKI